MKVAIIGGTGHIGSYLTPLLVEKGHDVTSMWQSTSANPISGARPGSPCGS